MAMAMGYTTARGRSGVTWFAPATARGACFCLRDWCLLLVISWVRGSSIIGPFVPVGKLRLAWSKHVFKEEHRDGTRVYVDLMIFSHFIEIYFVDFFAAAYVYYVMLKKEVLCTKMRIKKGERMYF
jgi:hypothetical protein